MKTIYLSFLWHMHQPYYKNIETNKFILPWVRLHGVKDYYDMVHILQKYHGIRQNFNLVPSLLKQIEEYLEGTTDIFMDMTLKRAQDLNEDERVFILNNFFMANWNTMVYPYKRYSFLLKKRGENTNPDEIRKIHKNFSIDEIRDLQTWFNLTWVDSDFYSVFPELKKLKDKEENFSEEEKKFVIDTHIKILRMIIPEYKSMQQNGIIEISTTPFYHPILPLLCNSKIAKVSLPDLQIDFDFSCPDDAKVQVEKAIKYYEEKFEVRPYGFWPSEGSVSDEVIDIFIKNNIKWIATDEDILKKTLSENNNNEVNIYKPYLFNSDSGNINIFFRNHYLSDLISFTYQSWNTNDAINHFISEIQKIGENSKDNICHISVILDGENAWEYYPNDGKEFLNGLYESFKESKNIKLITLNEATQIFKDKQILTKIFPGSWINHDFYIWIGHKDDRKAWQLLKMTRDDLIKKNIQDKEILKKAWEEIYIAEGSDWNWWYGDDHSSKNDAEFDNLFRLHLMNVYKLINEPIPDILYMPITKADRTFFLQPSKFIYPEIDGVITNFFEWRGAGVYDFSYEGTMHNLDRYTNSLYYGFNTENFYIRIDFLNKKFLKEDILEIKFISEKETGTIKINLSDLQIKSDIDLKDVLLNFKDIMEIKIPFENIKRFVNNNEISFIGFIKRAENLIEKLPEKGAVKIQVPEKDFELYNWVV